MFRLRRIHLFLCLAPVLLLVLLAGGMMAFQPLEIKGLPWQIYLTRSQLAADLSRQEVHTISLELRVDVTQGTLRGSSRLQARVQGSERAPCLRLMLNPGMMMESAESAGQPVRTQRHGAFLSIYPPLGTEDFTLDIRFHGTPLPGSAGVRMNDEEVILPALVFWHPAPLHGYAAYRVDLELPLGMEAVLGGQIAQQGDADGYTRWRWNSPRPLEGMSLAGTRGTGVGGRYGSVNTRGFFSGNERLERVLRDVGRLYAYYETALGAGTLNTIDVISTSALAEMQVSGQGLLLLPATQDSLEMPALAEATARLWFPGTVGGQWLGPTPGAGQWFAVGLPRFLSWQAIAYLESDEAMLREIARHTEELAKVELTPRPLRRIDRLDALRMPDDGPEREAYMAHVARMLSTLTGEQVLLHTLRQLLLERAYEVITLEKLVQPLELASEQRLEEWTRVWFDRSGRVDFALGEVHRAGRLLRVTVENSGTMPPPFPLGLRGGNGAASVHTLSVGNAGGVAEIPITGENGILELDPLLLLPDADRTNNRRVIGPNPTP